MIGVRKDSGVIRLLMAAALVLFVAACSSSDSGLKGERDQARDQVEELEDTVGELTGTVGDLRTELADLKASGTADADKIKMLEDRIAELEGIEQDVLDDAEKMKKASVLALYKGLDDKFNPANAGGLADGDLGDVVRFDVPDEVEFKITHGKPTKVTPVALVDDAGDAVDPRPIFGNNKLGDATGELSDAQGPWSSTFVTADDTGTKDSDRVVVFTDIAADTLVAFDKAGFTLSAEGLLTIEDTHAKYIASAMFSTEPGVTTHNPKPAVSGDTVRVPGTFAGAPGEFRCTETADASCESQGTNKGGVQLNNGPGGNWIFDPDTGAMAHKEDSGYSHFGWWWRIDKDDGYHLDVFHGTTGGTDVDNDSFTALTGTATYVGPAAGKFAINPQLPNSEPMGGHFTATATLMADFEAGDQGATATDPEPGQISGSIDGFTQDDVELPFVVTFGKTDITSDADGTSFMADDGAVWSISGEKSGRKGSWSGNFHNQPATGDDVPTTVTGEFAATFNEEVGRIEGAFGATRQ